MELNKGWILAACTRAVRTFFQAFASMLTVDGLAVGVTEIDWIHIASVATVSAIYSIVTSFAGLPEVERENTETE